MCLFVWCVGVSVCKPFSAFFQYPEIKLGNQAAAKINLELTQIQLHQR